MRKYNVMSRPCCTCCWLPPPRQRPSHSAGQAAASPRRPSWLNLPTHGNARPASTSSSKEVVPPRHPSNGHRWNNCEPSYKGRITSWKSPGGPDRPLELLARRGRLSGIGRPLRQLVFNEYDKDFVSDSRLHVVRAIAKGGETQPQRNRREQHTQTSGKTAWTQWQGARLREHPPCRRSALPGCGKPDPQAVPTVIKKRGAWQHDRRIATKDTYSHPSTLSTAHRRPSHPLRFGEFPRAPGCQSRSPQLSVLHPSPSVSSRMAFSISALRRAISASARTCQTDLRSWTRRSQASLCSGMVISANST